MVGGRSEEKVRARLEGSTEVFWSVVFGIKDAILEIMQKLGLDHREKVSHNSLTCGVALSVPFSLLQRWHLDGHSLRIQLYIFCQRKFSVRHSQSFNLAMKTYCSESVGISNLDTLTDQSVSLEPERQKLPQVRLLHSCGNCLLGSIMHFVEAWHAPFAAITRSIWNSALDLLTSYTARTKTRFSITCAWT